MPISHVSKIYAVEDCKIAKLSTDPSGGAATYGALVDVPGIKTVEISGDVNTVELRGDNQLLDLNSKLTNISVSSEHAKISLDTLQVMLGGTTTDSGVAPNQKATFDLLGADTMNYFKLEAKTPADGADSVGGDIHFVLHKLMLTSFPEMGHEEEDYRTVSFEAQATPLISSDKWLTVVVNETAAAIA